ncbi:DUF4153 domain-containing protein [Nocardioides deserti]|uniref:Signal transduction histidine-protein kinase/phosphatase MprB n=1 Tax=Nocardioides deserti TaxID=1588644 RepID=A0ABR6UAZ1_9ACTN|nr:DUF4153 domain-containing protein [Nocardioides deserti]MBC2961313.1 DUF4173 domain-containing protein [Nocardioides deserti]GGO72381.1 hypothetical protein GCM10012276_15590 [Nocardioides deserti]
MTPQPLAAVRSIKVKLGLLVAASVLVATAVATLGRAGGVPPWLGVPVTVALALAVTQLLAAGMTSPLRQMTAAARRMATGDHGVRVPETSRDEVGELARAFNTMAADLAAVDRQRRELVANVSHELRTPLTGMRALLENLADGVGPADPAALQVALGQAERTSRLVEDLLDLARVDAGRAPLVPEPVRLAALLADAVAEAEVLGRPVTYDVRVSPPDLVVAADPARLHQLVANLLDNASRHSPAGSTVRVEAGQEGERYVVEVHDAGPGIAPADRERVFEPFGTLAAGDATGGGTGLGLAIARWVSDLHGGTIGFVEPEGGPDGPGGARVRVVLPLSPPERVADEPVGSAGSETVAAQPPRPADVRAAGVAAPGVLDDLFGGFWPARPVPPRLGLLGGALATGALAATLLVERDLGLGTLLVLLAAGGVLLAATPRRRDPWTLGCAGLCVLLAVTTVVRDAEWLVVLCLLAGVATALCGVTRPRTAAGIVLTGLAWPLAGLRGLPWLGRTVARLTGRGQGAAVLRTLVWSVLGLVVFGALLVSADALLAEWVDAAVPDLTTDLLVARVFVTVAVGGVVLAAAYLALDAPRVDRGTGDPRPVGRRFEWLAPVLVVVGVFAVFLVAQATVVLAGHDHLRRTTGLTYAEYVHQGFGQLTVATALTLLVVWAAARKAPRATAADRAWLRGALGVLCLETLVVVGSALHRMHLYQEAYGFTTLRLLVDVVEGWLGLLVLASFAAVVVLRSTWFPRFALVSGVVALLGLAAVNPEAWVADHNLERYADTGRVDWTYLQGLSDDAVPTLVDGSADLTPDERSCVLAGRTGTGAGSDLWEWNLARSRAADALAGVRLEDAATTGSSASPCGSPS